MSEEVVSNETDGTNKEIKNEVTHSPQMTLPYGGEVGNNLIKKLKHTLHNALPNNVKPKIAVNGKKVSSYFPLKDKIASKHTTDFIYGYQCKKYHQCKSDYVGETGRRKEKREKEHRQTDKKSAIYKHNLNCNRGQAKEDEFTILAKGYPHWRRRKICEAMYIRDMKPKLNKQVQSYQLELFK